MKIFASYVRDQYEPLVKNIINDLKNGGHQILDPDQQLSNGNWQDQITNMIKECDAMIVFMSQKSMDRNSFCINEVDMAINNNKKIIPIKLEDATPYMPLVAIQYIDFSNIDQYPDRIKQLLDNLK